MPPNPAPTTPPPMPPEVQALITKSAEEAVTAALAARDAAAANGQGRAPGVLKYKGMFDTERPAHAALGLRMKAAYLEWEDRTGREASKERNKDLREFLTKVKAAGVFESVFSQGGGLWSRETVSEEVIDVLRPASILLSAGCRVESGYGSKLTIGVINEGVTVEWEGEDEEASESDMDTGDLVLGAYKAMGTTRISNQLMRKGTLKSAEQIATDIGRAMALAFDQAGLVGKGAKRPTGILYTSGITKSAFAGTSIANVITDTKGMVADILAANVPLTLGKPFWFMTSGSMIYLSSLRDSSASGTGGWVFPGLQDLSNPTMYGWPVKHTESLVGQKLIGLGLADELYFGNASPLEIELGENGSDFKRDRKTVRGVQEGDWQVRRPKAFSIRTGVTY